MIDALAYERHFVDHLAPVWLALPDDLRGRFLTDPDLVRHAASRGIDADGVVPPKPHRLSGLAAPHDRLALTASYGDIKKGRRLGYRRAAFLEHGIGQAYPADPRVADHASYAGGRDRGDVELFLVPNEYSARRWRSAYPAAAVAAVGCPKLDGLPTRQPGPGPVVALSFHWECRLTQETRSALATYLRVIGDVAERFTVIGHGHPRAIANLARFYRRSRIELVEDFTDVCRRADVYVCDNSSSLYEFAATGRPVVVLNAPWYRRHFEHGLRFWEAAGIGVNVGTADELVPAIERALADPPDLAAGREAALRLVYAHRAGAAERAAAALVSWASTEMAA